jgi:hypothetical protein
MRVFEFKKVSKRDKGWKKFRINLFTYNIKLLFGTNQALKLRSVTDIVRPIRSGAVAGGARGAMAPLIVETRRKIVNVVGNCRKIVNVVGNCQSCRRGGGRGVKI